MTFFHHFKIYVRLKRDHLFLFYFYFYFFFQSNKNICNSYFSLIVFIINQKKKEL
jgi:hypothetical protein